MNPTRRLFMIVAKGAVLFTLTSWALVLILWRYVRYVSPAGETVAGIGVVFVPDAIATWCILRRLQAAGRSQSEARRAATAFAVSAPVVLGISHLLGELVGGYAEAFLGGWFILPSVVLFVIMSMILIPGGVVMWALHPSDGIEPVGGRDLK